MKKSLFLRPVLPVLLACAVLTLTAPAGASVVLTGTRIIYPATATAGKTLQLSNADDHPWLVQMWLDAGQGDSTPEQAAGSVPFVVMPPIFRVEAHSGQGVRVRLTTDAGLPGDRESLFYLNFTQIPPQDPAAQDENRLLLVHNTRVKLFYRPRGLAQPDFGALACGLRVSVDGGTVTVDNPAPFHTVVARAELVTGEGNTTPLFSSEMLEPFSSRSWPLASPPPADQAALLRVSLVNDYGADERHDCPLR